MGYINLKISGKNGKMYESSRDPKEGFEKVLYGENNSKVTYHKYHDKIEGKFIGFNLSDMVTDRANITLLNVKLQGIDDLYTVSVPLKTAYGGISDAAKSLVSSFYNAVPEHDYTMTSFIKKNEKDGKSYDNQVVYVNSKTEIGENGKGLSTGFIPFNDVPRADKKDDGFGKITYDNTNVNMFFATKIREIESKFNLTVYTEQNQSQTGNSKTDIPRNNHSVEDDDFSDLPF